MMIVLALIALIALLFVSAGAFVLLFRILTLLAKIVLALSIGAGLGVIVSLVANACGGDGSSIGVAVGFLCTAGTIAVLQLPKRRTGSIVVRPFANANMRLSSAKKLARPIRLIEPRLADQVESVTRAIKEAIITHPFDINFIEWSEVLDRVPELIAETKSLYSAASKEEQITLRKQLADDLNSIVDEAERRLSTIRRERHAILRRWVAIRTGRD